ncbi:MAG: hypothetical protein KGI35_01180 [Burkholderiales bacterium]|nr:hypothetical protein [Burkholderiales bacterium]
MNIFSLSTCRTLSNRRWFGLLRQAAAMPIFLGLLASCGGGGGNGSTVASPGVIPATFTIGGKVQGLPQGTTLKLQSLSGELLAVSSNSTFNFLIPVSTGSAYAVTVAGLPPGETCGVSNGTGTVGQASIASVVISCGSTASVTATTGSTAFSALSAGNSRIAMVPLNLPKSTNVHFGVMPVVIDGQSVITGTFVQTSFAIQSCSTDSASMIAVCINYSSSMVAVLDLAKFATTFAVADIGVSEFDTGVPQAATPFSGGSCMICGVVAVPAIHSFVVSASDGYRIYNYPVAGAASPLAPAKIYAIPIAENFALSNSRLWVFSADYGSTGGPRVLRVIDLASQRVYAWDQYTNQCSATDGAACTNFGPQVVDSITFSDDTGLLTLDDESGDSQLTVDMSQAVFSDSSLTFSAPHAYSGLSVVDTLGLGEVSGLLASSTGHWGFAVAEFSGAVVGVQQLPISAGTGNALAPPTPDPIYADLSTLVDHAPCAFAPAGGQDPHAQGYTLTSAGVPLGLFISGDSRCMAVINLALLDDAPRQAGALGNLLDTSNYDPVKSGAVTFYALPNE